MIKVVLKRTISSRVLGGHPWIYNNEVDSVSGDYSDGDIVEVLTFDRKFFGRGYFHGEQ